MSPVKKPKIIIEHADKTLLESDMSDLCDATEAAILKGGGFGWVDLPARDILERYWNGVILIQHRDLFLARVDDTIAGTAQLVRQPSNNQAQSFAAQLTTFFVSPWARNMGVGKQLIATAEAFAKKSKIDVINLDVRTTQTEGIKLFESQGYKKWGENPLYAKVKGKTIKGFFYHKEIK